MLPITPQTPCVEETGISLTNKKFDKDGTNITFSNFLYVTNPGVVIYWSWQECQMWLWCTCEAIMVSITRYLPSSPFIQHWSAANSWSQHCAGVCQLTHAGIDTFNTSQMFTLQRCDMQIKMHLENYTSLLWLCSVKSETKTRFSTISEEIVALALCWSVLGWLPGHNYGICKLFWVFVSIML